MGNYPSFLSSGQYISAGTGMTSAGGVYTLRLNSTFCVGVPWTDIWCNTLNPPPGDDYFMFMQTDGNLCIYPGEDGAETGPAVWASNSGGAPGDFYAVLLDNAELEIHRGTNPDDDQGLHWSSETDPRYNVKPNPITNIANITTIAYDVASGVITKSVPDMDLGPAATMMYTNNLPNKQSFTMKLKAVSTTESNWSDALEVGFSVTVKASCDIPFVASGEIDVTSDVKNTYTWGGSDQQQDSVEYDYPLVIGPGSCAQGSLLATRSTISVPYAVHATLTLSYADTPAHCIGAGTYSGVYTGTNSWGVSATSGPCPPPP